MYNLYIVTCVIMQSLGLFTMVLSVVLFKTKPFKQEYVLFGMAGLTTVLLSGLARLIGVWFS